MGQRIIGILHRVKMSAEGEPRPTIVAIKTGDTLRKHELATEQDELDFVLGQFPVRMRQAREGEDLSTFQPHHIKQTEARTMVPDLLDGITDGDTVAMMLGGSGDYFAYALSRAAESRNGQVIRIPSFVLADERGNKDKKDDAVLLAELAVTKPHLFYAVADRDRAFINARIRYNLRMDAMKARIACEQRLRQRYIGNVFTSPEGLYPEGGVEKAFDAVKATDAILLALEEEEKKAIKDLAAAVEPLDVFEKVFSPVEGMDVKIAARIIANVVDIRQFATVHKFVAFCGVHVLEDGRFARRRNNERANWNNDCRQALYLFAKQANFRAESRWGQKLRQIKATLRQKHPEPVVGEKGKKRYTNGHIHAMASWRLATLFARHIYKEWQKLERGESVQRMAA